VQVVYKFYWIGTIEDTVSVLLIGEEGLDAFDIGAGIFSVGCFSAELVLRRQFQVGQVRRLVGESEGLQVLEDRLPPGH